MIKLFKVLDWSLSQDDYEYLLSFINKDEKERIKRFKHKLDSLRSLSGILIAKSEISKITGIPLEKVDFKRTKENKPIFEISDYDLKFNISHSGDYVAVIINFNNNVGIDLEKVETNNSMNVNEFLDSFNDVFSEYELSQIKFPLITGSSIHVKDIYTRFYINWTLKESYLKCIGVGLIDKMKDIEFRLIDNIAYLYLDGSLNSNFQFHYKSYSFDGFEYILSYCLEKKEDINTEFKIEEVPSKYFNSYFKNS